MHVSPESFLSTNVFRVIALTIIRLVLLPDYFSSVDPIFNSIASGIATQALLSVPITTACVPALKPFLDGFESGMLGVSLKQRSAPGTFNRNSYELNNSNSGNKSALRSRNRNREKAGEGIWLLSADSRGEMATRVGTRRGV